jgi:hypothetical protein
MVPASLSGSLFSVPLFHEAFFPNSKKESLWSFFSGKKSILPA